MGKGADKCVYEVGYWVLDGGDGDKLVLGAGVPIILRLGDRAICLLAREVPGSCKGYLAGYLMSCMVLRPSTMILIVGLSDGSFCRHL